MIVSNESFKKFTEVNTLKGTALNLLNQVKKNHPGELHDLIELLKHIVQEKPTFQTCKELSMLAQILYQPELFIKGLDAEEKESVAEEIRCVLVNFINESENHVHSPSSGPSSI